MISSAISTVSHDKKVDFKEIEIYNLWKQGS